MNSSKIYFDNAATTHVHPQVRALMMDVLSDGSANPSSTHSAGMRARLYVEKARQQIAKSLNAQTSRLFFTSGGTESNNLAIIGYCLHNRARGTHLITSQIEHPSVLEPFRWLERNGFSVTYLAPNKEGVIAPADLQHALQKDTLLVSIMHANNEVGSLQDIRALGKICRDHHVVFHSDATQTFGKVPMSVIDDNVDLLTLSSHKVHGPKGAGALYIKDSLSLQPVLFGGGQENGQRSGTHNVEAIAGFGLAAEMAHTTPRESIRNLRQRLRNALFDRIQSIALNGSETECLDNILNVFIDGVEAIKVLHALDKKGIQISAGSACSAGKKTASHVLKAMGFDDKRASETLRFSLSAYNTADEVDRVANELSLIVDQLRGLQHAST